MTSIIDQSTTKVSLGTANIFTFGILPVSLSYPKLTEKLDLSTSYHLWCDSEFTAKLPQDWTNKSTDKTTFLIKQHLIEDQNYKQLAKVILWDYRLSLPSSVPLDVTLVVCDCHKTTIFDVANLSQENLLWFFYSPKDVEAVVSKERWLEALLLKDAEGKSIINKRRNLSGTIKNDQIGTIKLRDIIGMFNSSLKSALESVGLSSKTKSTMKDLDMSKMADIINKFPDESLEYALGDVDDLSKAYHLRIKQLNEIVTQVHPGIVELTSEDIPRSSGSLVWTVFENWLLLKYPGLYKASLLLTDCNNNKFWSQTRKFKDAIRESFNKPEADLSADQIKQISTRINYSKSMIHGLGMGMISNYALLSHSGTGVINAMVQGGRCNPEVPHENPYDGYLVNVYDPDLNSCYGTKLREYDFPFGIPTIFENAISDSKKLTDAQFKTLKKKTTKHAQTNGKLHEVFNGYNLTLGQFLSIFESELVPNLWQIIVAGQLPFKQDLVFSKLGVTTSSVINKITGDYEKFVDGGVYGDEIELTHIEGDFRLIMSEIENGVINQKVLDAIKKVSTPAELKAWMQLEVICAAFYPQSLQVSHSQFIGNVLKSKGKTRSGDNRTRSWTKVALDDFIGGFIDKRAVWKKASKDKSLSQAERSNFNLLQTGTKLFINTLYGDTAAPYFPLGNTILANNITAAARVGVWQMSKALLLAQTITDGGLGSLKECLKFKSGNIRKPGFDTLAIRSALKSHRYVEVVPVLSSLQEALELSKDGKFDPLLKSLVDSFWSTYGLTFDFDIEAKSDNFGEFAIYFNASDYLVYNMSSEGLQEVVLKSRGAKQDNHPKKVFLRHLADPYHYPLPNPCFEYNQLIGVSEFQKQSEKFIESNLMPGDEQTKLTVHRPKNRAKPWLTIKDIKSTTDVHQKAIRLHIKANEGNTNPDYFGVVKKMAEGKLKAKR